MKTIWIYTSGAPVPQPDVTVISRLLGEYVAQWVGRTDGADGAGLRLELRHDHSRAQNASARAGWRSVLAHADAGDVLLLATLGQLAPNGVSRSVAEAKALHEWAATRGVLVWARRGVLVDGAAIVRGGEQSVS